MIEIIDYSIKLARLLNPSEATKLRGYFGDLYSEEVQLHHHLPDGRLLYEYPRVQFKVLQRKAHLIGVAEGVDLVTRLWSEVEKTRVGDEELPILESTLVRRSEIFGESEELVGYQFRTPWLGLNQENHGRFLHCGTDKDRDELLGKIILGNCLSVAKSLGHKVKKRLTVNADGLRRTETRLKGVPMLAFVGTFQINFRLPDHLGIGKSVSRGFGTIERL